ncbi:hypothetical protein GCM10010253_58540 [Streptomyces badius]|uniref:Phosphatase n=1 Tax=Streptomyces badius TaxID=1941 RepID=A0ABQ2TLP7_STRBA|nr:hypothetical protein GCM10010253_58540 [Streptomyces badius]
MRISAVLFDVDGVLLDSAGAHRRVWDAWSAARGLDPEKVWELTFGRRPEDTVRDVAAHLDPEAERSALDRLLAQETPRIGVPGRGGRARRCSGCGGCRLRRCRPDDHAHGRGAGAGPTT